MEVDFSSDTSSPAEQVYVVPGILLPALVCLTLISDAGAERFVLVNSVCFFCLFLLGIRRDIKATVLGGPWRSLRSLCCSSEAHTWADGWGILSWYWCRWPMQDSVLQGSVDQNVGAQRWRRCCVESGESTAFVLQEVRAGLSQFCELMQRWDLQWNTILCYTSSVGQKGKYFHCTLIHPLLLQKFWMVHTSLRALWVMFPPYMPPHSLGCSFGLFSTTHSIKKWSAMRALPIHHELGEDLSWKGDMRWDTRWDTPDSSLLLAGEARFRAWWLQADGSFGLGVMCCSRKPVSRAGLIVLPLSHRPNQSLPFGESWTGHKPCWEPMEMQWRNAEWL